MNKQKAIDFLRSMGLIVTLAMLPIIVKAENTDEIMKFYRGTEVTTALNKETSISSRFRGSNLDLSEIDPNAKPAEDIAEEIKIKTMNASEVKNPADLGELNSEIGKQYQERLGQMKKENSERWTDKNAHLKDEQRNLRESVMDEIFSGYNVDNERDTQKEKLKKLKEKYDKFMRENDLKTKGNSLMKDLDNGLYLGVNKEGISAQYDKKGFGIKAKSTPEEKIINFEFNKKF